mmetsp:Transcript_3860/g.3794  ORF Transcript_3860/g.3794 Transcript_3860/m.3794 type:complete len:241 (-) Transcript_3860:20-742(-)
MKDNWKCQLAIRGGHNGVINSLLRINEDKVASGCADNGIRIFDLNSKDLESPVQKYEQNKSGVQQIKVLDQHCLTSFGQDKNAYVWDLRIQNMPAITFQYIHSSTVNCLEVLQPKQFITTSDDGLVNFWDLRTKKNLKFIQFDDQVVASAIFIRKKYLVVAHNSDLSVFSNQDNFVKRQTFKMPTAKESLNEDLFSTAEDFSDQWTKKEKIKAIAYSEQDKKIYTGGFLKRINVWNVDLS